MLNLGIIGFGGMAEYHFKSLKGYERINIKGVFDINPERCKFAQEQGLKAYISREELFSDPDIDIILVATTNEVHKELLIEAMKAGKHVISEKPVTLTSSELEEVIAASKEYKRVFTIDQ